MNVGFIFALVIFAFEAHAFPDSSICEAAGWDLGPDSDPTPGLILPGQQVYIKDANNFCLNLPDPDSPYLIDTFYKHGLLPSIVQAEGYVHAFCVGDYLTPGASKMIANGIRSAHVTINNSVPGNRYVQIYGQMDCGILGINCTQSAPEMYDDGGQYDSVRYRNCGKEPYSGVDTSVQGPTFDKYVEQAGDGFYCMRVCEGGMQENDPCNAKMDRDGCVKTMGMTWSDMAELGFTTVDVTRR